MIRLFASVITTCLLLQKSSSAPHDYCDKDIFAGKPAELSNRIVVLNSSDEIKESTFFGITASNITVLCKHSIRNLPELTHIHFDGNNMEDMQPGAFYNLPKIYQIYIGRNAIKTIKKGVFNGLALKELILVDDGIEAVEKGAFDNMTELYQLSLAGNLLRHLDPNWFSSKRISHLDLSRNHLETLPVATFQHFLGKELWLGHNRFSSLKNGTFRGISNINKLSLEGNRIVRFEEGVFDNVRIGSLELDDNRLECLSDGVLRGLRVDVLGLKGNPLDCPKCMPKLSWAKGKRTVKTDCLPVRFE